MTNAQTKIIKILNKDASTISVADSEKTIVVEFLNNSGNVKATRTIRASSLESALIGHDNNLNRIRRNEKKFIYTKAESEVMLGALKEKAEHIAFCIKDGLNNVEKFQKLSIELANLTEVIGKIERGY